MPEAIATLQSRGARRIAVASWFLAPGLLPDKVLRQAPDTALLTAPLGADPAIATLIVHRFEATLLPSLARPA